jgi:hypothetical protein
VDRSGPAWATVLVVLLLVSSAFGGGSRTRVPAPTNVSARRIGNRVVVHVRLVGGRKWPMGTDARRLVPRSVLRKVAAQAIEFTYLPGWLPARYRIKFYGTSAERCVRSPTFGVGRTLGVAGKLPARTFRRILASGRYVQGVSRAAHGVDGRQLVPPRVLITVRPRWLRYLPTWLPAGFRLSTYNVNVSPRYATYSFVRGKSFIDWVVSADYSTAGGGTHYRIAGHSISVLNQTAFRCVRSKSRPKSRLLLAAGLPLDVMARVVASGRYMALPRPDRPPPHPERGVDAVRLVPRRLLRAIPAEKQGMTFLPRWVPTGYRLAGVQFADGRTSASSSGEANRRSAGKSFRAARRAGWWTAGRASPDACCSGVKERPTAACAFRRRGSVVSSQSPAASRHGSERASSRAAATSRRSH